jgi:cytochrome P450
VVLVNSAELAAELCDESRFQKAIPTAVAALRAFVGDGLVTAYNDEPNWRLAHDLLVPAFTQGAMRRYHPVMVQAGDELLARWDSATGPVDVPGDMTRVTLETIGRAGFSQPFGSFESTGQHPFVAGMVAVMAEGQRAALMAAVPGARIFARAAERSYRQKTGYLWDFIDDIIVRRRAEGGEGPDDLLGLMLNAVHPETAERLDDQNIRYQILTFLAAGTRPPPAPCPSPCTTSRAIPGWRSGQSRKPTPCWVPTPTPCPPTSRCPGCVTCDGCWTSRCGCGRPRRGSAGSPARPPLSAGGTR